MTLDARPSDEELLRLASARTVQEQGARSDTAPSAQQLVGKKSSRMVMPAKGRMAERPAFSSVQIVVPFKHLVSDNRKFMTMKGTYRLISRPEYRQAKDTIQHIARRAMQGKEAAATDVEINVTLWVPDNRRRDTTNFAKLIQDSMEGYVYLNDTQIKKATYENAGIDRENPRVEITVTKRSAQ